MGTGDSLRGWGNKIVSFHVYVKSIHVRVPRVAGGIFAREREREQVCPARRSGNIMVSSLLCKNYVG